MTTNRSLTLHVDPHADPELISGWISDEGGDEQHFEGWLGLFTLLEQNLWQPADAANARLERQRDVAQPATSKETQWITAPA
jgi:hypothetical protein